MSYDLKRNLDLKPTNRPSAGASTGANYATLAHRLLLRTEITESSAICLSKFVVSSQPEDVSAAGLSGGYLFSEVELPR